MESLVTRKAILIGSPGSGSNHLSGVSVDLKNVRNFLLSDYGGRWLPEEIITLSNPTYEQVIKYVHSTKVEYNFIYFSGHGYTSPDNKRMLALCDKDVNDTFFLNKSHRQLVIIDACRVYVRPGISGVPEFAEPYSSFDGYYEARELFNRYIKNSPYGKTIVHSTGEDQYSYDSLNGGYFTTALIKKAINVRSENYRPLFVSKLIDILPQISTVKGEVQRPEIVYAEGRLLVPIALAIPKDKMPKPIVSERKLEPVDDNNSSGGGWAILGIAALLIVAASSSK
jgi:hypothetical protein